MNSALISKEKHPTLMDSCVRVNAFYWLLIVSFSRDLVLSEALLYISMHFFKVLIQNVSFSFSFSRINLILLFTNSLTCPLLNMAIYCREK